MQPGVIIYEQSYRKYANIKLFFISDAKSIHIPLFIAISIMVNIQMGQMVKLKHQLTQRETVAKPEQPCRVFLVMDAHLT